MAKQVRPAFCDSAKRSDPSRSSPYKEPERAYSIMARAGIPLTDRPDIYLQSSLQAIIVSSLANRVESIYTLAHSQRGGRYQPYRSIITYGNRPACTKRYFKTFADIQATMSSKPQYGLLVSLSAHVGSSIV